MKPCEVRCGNPSQYEAQRERTVTEGGVWAVAFQERWSQSYKRICGQGKSERKTGNRTPKASKAINQLNYFSRRAIKGIQHSHTESQDLIPGKVFQPTHPFGHETPQCYFTTLCFTSKKKRTLDIVCLMSYDSVWKCKCETHLHPKSLLLLSLFPPFSRYFSPHTALICTREKKDEDKVMRKWNDSLSEANLLPGADACYCVQDQRGFIWFRIENIAGIESVAYT